MAKRGKTKPTDGGQTTTAPSGAVTLNAMEERVVAFAEKLGRIAAIVQTRAEGWMDRETLARQIVSVRDGAAELLKHLARGAKTSTQNHTAAAPRAGGKGRSGGAVDAPGKKHRKPTPSDPDANVVDSQAAKMRTAKTMVKTTRRRGRG